MTSTVTNISFDREGFEALLQSRDEPAWLGELRQSCWNAFDELPKPSQRDEEWMRTDIRLFHLDRFAISQEPALQKTLPDSMLDHGVELAGKCASLDSQSAQSELDPLLAKKGVLFGSLEQLVREHSELLEPYFAAQVVDSQYDKFAALSGAFWSGGNLLFVPRGVAIDRPFHLLSAMSDGGTDLGRTLVILEDNAEATLLAETASSTNDATGLHCGTIELIVGNNAKLRYVNLQNWGAGVWHFAHQKATLARDAQLQWTIGALGSKLAKVNQHVALAGEGAHAQVNGVLFTEGKQHLSYHTLQHHEAANCRSDLLYKGGLQDRSRIVWRGMIKVDVDAQKTDGYQRNDSLMLSNNSRSDSIPGLEIEADDVRCTHGSTAGQVDEEQIFYARCRGLTRNEAVQMIVAGFFQQIFDRITIESVRNSLGEAIRRRIRNYD